MPAHPRLALLGALAALVVLPVACGGDESAGPESGVTLSQVLDEPEKYVGRQVTLSGEVVESDVARGAFTLGGSTEGDDAENVLVLAREGARAPAGLRDGAVVRVQGTVRRADEETIRTEDLLFESAAESLLQRDTFNGRPVVAASRIDTAVVAGDGS